MEIADHIAQLRVDGEIMAETATRAGADAPIPTCPDWTMRDLLLHQGEVHRWANAHVAGALTAPADSTAARGPLPSDDRTIEWFREGYRTLADTLTNTDTNVECWSFLPAPSPLAFWARRQCHETGIHRADAQSALGEMTSFPPAVAADGIDELLAGFVVRRSGALRSDPPARLGVHSVDTDERWLLHITQEPVVTERDGTMDDADCVITAPASDLHLFLWNRVDRSHVETSGNDSVLDLWHDLVAIRWT